jgi:5'-phosphate synthase pdxT subunit
VPAGPGVSRIPGSRLDVRSAWHSSWSPGTADIGAADRGALGAAADGGAGHAAPAVGILALQGDVLEHARALVGVGMRPVPVRRTEDLDGLSGLVLPGGESTAISRALVRGGLAAPLTAFIRSGMPVLGTCAGLILLSDELAGHEDLPRPAGLAVRTRRNAYGPQTASFDVAFEVSGVDGGPMQASFIRAPRIEAVLSAEVEVLAEVAGHAVAVRQGDMIAMSFHPEVSGDLRMHELLAASVRARAAR